MLNIRMKNIVFEKSSHPSNISIDIKPYEIIGITGEGKERFMLALMGKKDFDGDIVFEQISLKADYNEYIKYFEYISDTKRKRRKRTIVHTFSARSLSEIIDSI